MAALVFDEQIASPRIIQALAERGTAAQTIADMGAAGRPDPDVIRRIVRGMGAAPWVLVTLDLSITDEFPGFDWQRYAIAWVMLRGGVRGGAVEIEKTDIVQRHAHDMRSQQPGDHHTYTVSRRYKHPPSLASLMRRP